MALDDPLVVLLIAVAVIVSVAVTALGLRWRNRKPVQPSSEDEEFQPVLKDYPFKLTKSVASEDASKAKDELRILELEREILSDAIRRLYEAHAEGKISEEERERLAKTYKSRMMTVKDAMAKDESVVALHELEAMQSDLMKLFTERFDDLNGKIEELRSKAEAKPIKEITIRPPVEQALSTEIETVDEGEEKGSPEEKAKRKRKPSAAKTDPRSEAEKRVEEIREEVEKVLDKLGQMEIES